MAERARWWRSRIRRGGSRFAAGFVLTFVLPAGAQALCGDFGLPEGAEVAELDTLLGSICIELLRDDAPLTVDNFLAYLNRGDFDDTIVHRNVPGFVIQGGAFRSESDVLSVIPTDPPVLNEPCTADIDVGGGGFICSVRGNEFGTVAMARSSSVNSATNQWFINLADNRGAPAFLDTQNEGFTVFGRVLGNSMDVALAIEALATNGSDEMYWLNPALAGALTSAPILAPVPLLDAPFGCFDPNDLTAVVNPLNDLQGLSDPETGDTFFFLSGGCGTKIPRGSFDPTPVPPCIEDNLLSTAVTGPASLGLIIDPETADFLQYAFDCDEAAEALAQRALWRADYRARLSAELAVVEVATVHTVPEPSTNVLASAGMALLLFLHRRRDRAASGSR